MGSIFSKVKEDFNFFNRNFDTNLYIKNFELRLPEMNKIMKKSGILQFDNYPKHRSLKALEFYKENNIKIVNYPSNSPDFNLIVNIRLI